MYPFQILCVIEKMNDIESKRALISNLSNEIALCKKCPLWRTRNTPLVGDGSPGAKIIMIGESPGYHEDIQGKAFVGKAGEILNKLLEEINLSRNNIYITNVLKCHPPRNHNPKPEEIKACINYLYEQIKIIQPAIIIPLGKFASETIFAKVRLPFSRISDIHGKIFEIRASYGTVKIIPLYHPSVASYNVSMFDTLKEDIKNSVGKILP